MALWVGTSGFQYPEWKGSFYPQSLPAAKMLAYYAQHFPTVEINYTFYRTPSASTLQGWSRGTPEPFRLTLKAPKRITHIARLTNCAAAVRDFCALAATLGPKLGVLLFQLPPFLRKDSALLQDFLSALPPEVRATFEFRHASWLDEEVFSLLAEKNQALCVADSEKMTTPLRITASYAYFRLRDEGYTGADLRQWARRIREATAHCEDVFVYFKHEESGKGPQFARTLLEAWGAG